jgi:hypothetical protein
VILLSGELRAPATPGGRWRDFLRVVCGRERSETAIGFSRRTVRDSASRVTARRRECKGRFDKGCTVWCYAEREAFAEEYEGTGPGSSYAAAPVEKVGAGDATLALRRFGSGPPILLVHGFPLHGYTWRAAALSHGGTA